jgi:hypothetical protein
VLKKTLLDRIITLGNKKATMLMPIRAALTIGIASSLRLRPTRTGKKNNIGISIDCHLPERLLAAICSTDIVNLS